MRRKLILFTLGFISFLVIVSVVLYAIYNEPLPTGKSTPQADILAQKMLHSINAGAFKDTRYLEWTFRNGAHKYLWDKTMGKAKVSWNDLTVDLVLENPMNSVVLKNGVAVVDDKQCANAIEKAITLFNNDSFWLVAPFKVFDEGVERSLVALEDGSKGLMVTYTTGGSTPGDSYLWKLQSNGFPISFKMWVKILPIGGLEATWDDWQLVESGAFLPKSHQLGPLTLNMGNVKGYN